MFISGTAHTIELPLFDSLGDSITSGTVTTEISKDSAAYAATDNAAVHVDEELWTLTLTGTEATCSKYRIRVTHDDMAGPIIYTDESTLLRTNVIQISGEAVELMTTDTLATDTATAIGGLVSVSTTTVGRAPVVNIEKRQHEAFGSQGFTSDTAQTGDSHTMVFFVPGTSTAAWRYTTADGEISVGGDGDKTITVTADDTHLDEAGTWSYVLFNTTDDEAICQGSLTVFANPDPVEAA